MIVLARATGTLALFLVSTFVLIVPYRNQLRFSYPVTIILSAAGCFIYTFSYHLVDFNVFHLGRLHIVASCFGILLMSVAVTYLTKNDLTIVLFSVFVLRNLTDSLMLAARFIHVFLLPELRMSEYVIPLLYALFCIAAAPGLLHFVEKDIKPNAIYLSARTRKIIWCIPFGFYCFFRLSANIDYMKEVIPWSLHTVLLPVSWFFCTMICHYVLLIMVRETAQATELREQLKYSELITEVQRREYTSLESNIKETRALRHDMRHHLLALDGYLNEPDIPSARNYLNSLLNSIDAVQLKPYCLNYAVNSLLNHYADKAAQNNIKVSITVNLHEELPIADTDFCTILGNLFENALEACMRSDVSNPFISLNMGYAGSSMLVLSVRNSYSGTIRMSEGNFLSSKRNEAGIGTASIRYMAEKHNGICRFHYDNNIFEASILLNPYLSGSTESGWDKDKAPV